MGFLILFLMLAVPAAIIFFVRRGRAKGSVKTVLGRCEVCSQHAALIHVTLRQNTGMLIARQYRTLAGSLCGPCARTHFWKIQLHNMFLGWWSQSSIIINPFYMTGNWYHFMNSLTLVAPSAVAHHALADHKDYALSLLATKDEDTVVDVLVRETNAAPADVRAFVKTLYPEVKAA